MPRAKTTDGMVTPLAVEVWHALRKHGPCSATRLHALRGAPGRAAATSDRLVELLYADPPCVEVDGYDKSGRGLHARIYKVTREPKARPPKGSALEQRVIELITAAGGTLDFAALHRSTRANRDTLAAACKRLVSAQRLSKTPGSRPSFTLQVSERASRQPKRDPAAVRLSERYNTTIGPSGRRLAVHERYEDA